MTTTPAPSRRQLLVTLAATAAAAALVLVLVVLPAEYGIDPTGSGAALGLSRLRGAPPSAITDLPPAGAGAARAHEAPWKSEQVSLDLAAGEEMEFKIAMDRGATVVFAWTSDGPLDSDFHAEPYGEPEGGAIRYREEKGATAGNGALQAPFAGHHGWYWANRGAAPVRITLAVAGFYDALTERRR